MIPISLSGFVGYTAFLSTQERDVNCFGQLGEWFDVGPLSVNFSSDNTSIATVNSSGQTIAVSVGSTQFRASWETPNWIADPILGCFNDPRTTERSSSCAVAARISLGMVSFISPNPQVIRPGETGVLRVVVSADPGTPTTNVTVEVAQTEVSGTLTLDIESANTIPITGGQNIAVDFDFKARAAQPDGFSPPVTLKGRATITSPPPQGGVNADSPKVSSNTLTVQ